MTFRWARSRRFFFLLFLVSPLAGAGGVAGPGPLERVAGLADPAVLLCWDRRPAAARPGRLGGGLPGRDLGLVGGGLPGDPLLGQGDPGACLRAAVPRGSRPGQGPLPGSRPSRRAPRPPAWPSPSRPPGPPAPRRPAPRGYAGRRGRRRRACPPRTGRPPALVGAGVAGRHLRRELPQPVLGPVRVLRRARGDLRPIDRHRADPPHAQPGAQQQDLREQGARRSRRTAAGTAPPSRGPAPAPRRSP